MRCLCAVAFIGLPALLSVHCCITNVSQQMPFESSFDIRTFHTDGFGHVNNARYLELLEEARWQFAENHGLVELLRAENLGFIIMDLKIRFRAPVVEGDRITVKTSLISLGSASGEVKQVVQKNDSPGVATRCLSHFILIDRNDGSSVPIEGKIQKLLAGIIEPERNSPHSRSLRSGLSTGR